MAEVSVMFTCKTFLVELNTLLESHFEHFVCLPNETHQTQLIRSLEETPAHEMGV